MKCWPSRILTLKLGKPTLAADDQDYYIVSETETVQIAYDTAHKTKAISVDFVDGIGGPDYRAVVGPDLQINADGSMYKLSFTKVMASGSHTIAASAEYPR